eukprot:TRINITY_DN32360_c0_g1_i1.p1 TRINITY_DN32360_c0_g1~~TRINITY_DN32360_c0_g1_i1.p1  ORF type:complete len:300 (+),score=103.22 TRINITY_DN32360_c0_g1_i1:122-901(+)
MAQKCASPLARAAEFEAELIRPADDPSIELHTQAAVPKLAEAPGVLAVITHPYGSLGGDMMNPVVHGLALKCVQQGFVTVKLDFRGAGRSDGTGTWRGRGEQEDVKAAVAHYSAHKVFQGQAPKLLFIGYSFGSVIAGSLLSLYEPRLLGYVAVAYPFSVVWFLTMFRTAEVQAPLAAAGVPMLFLHGTKDNFSSGATVEAALARLAPKRKTLFFVDGADHFFARRHHKAALLNQAEEFLEKVTADNVSFSAASKPREQ